MRVVFEAGDKPEVKALFCHLQKCGIDFIVVENDAQQAHRRLCDEALRAAIRRVARRFTVGRQWAAVYRVLVDFHGFPANISEFTARMQRLMKGAMLTYPCDYQSVQKPLAEHRILRKHYSEWEKYQPVKRDCIFSRQKMTADALLREIAKAKPTINLL